MGGPPTVYACQDEKHPDHTDGLAGWQSFRSDGPSTDDITAGEDDLVDAELQRNVVRLSA
jgi:hypothetical protein